MKVDAVLAAAVDLAREGLSGIAEDGAVGEHVGMRMVDERLGTHLFACTSAAYPGWQWAVTVARVPMQARPTRGHFVLHDSFRPADLPTLMRKVHDAALFLLPDTP